jgi:hypothetical protein
MDVFLTGIGFLLGVFVPHGVIRWDERRMTEAMRGRGWNDASHWVAIVGFSFLCLPIHFAKTRRSVLGFLLGLVWMLLSVLFTGLALEGMAWVLEG